MELLSHQEPMVPGSPSLTNPDLILPYSSRNSTPSPVRRLYPSTTTDRRRMYGSVDRRQSAQDFSYRNGGIGASWRPMLASMNMANGSADHDSRYEEDDQDEPIPSSPLLPRGYGDEDDEPTALSMRTEQILANAKKRLSDMESNLSRARSVSLSRSTSVNSMTSNSYRTTPQSKNRTSDSWATPPSANSAPSGHSRVFSEADLPTPISLLTGRPIENGPYRSRSALGSLPGGPQQEISPSGSAGSKRYTGRFTLLEPLREDDLGIPRSDSDSPHNSPNPQNESTRPSPILRSSSSQSGHALNRARSNLQLRDLREQMSDLRGKITSLKQRTREDSLHRRSLQNMKVANPFTHAEEWEDPTKTTERESARNSTQVTQSDVGPLVEHTTAGSMLEAASLPGHRHLHEDHVTASSNYDVTPRESSPGQDQESSPVKHSPAHKTSLSQSEINPKAFRASVYEIVDGDETPEAVNGYASYSGQEQTLAPEEEEVDESFYSNRPISERHEDRPDAFDYEHFFLHSAMGSYSREGVHSRSNSTDSISTTRAPLATNPAASSYEPQILDDHFLDGYTSPAQPNSISPDSIPATTARSADRRLSKQSVYRTPDTLHSWDHQVHPHGRKDSSDSVSTAATFTTANERNITSRQSLACSSHSTQSRTNSFDNYPHAPPPQSRSQSFDQTSRAQRGRNGTLLAPPTNVSPGLVAAQFVEEPPLSGLLGSFGGLASSDQMLVARLVESVQAASEALAGTTEGSYERKVWRRRVDRARAVLGGEDDG